MRVAASESPGEFAFALLMAASPIIGSFWVDPEVTRWIVFGVGVAMVVGVILAALRPLRSAS
jgi:hypothetical protein